MDRLSTLLSHFGVSAGTFHSGTFCGTTGFDGEQACGHLHLLKAGELTLKLGDERDIQLNKPTLIFSLGPSDIACLPLKRPTHNWCAPH